MDISHVHRGGDRVRDRVPDLLDLGGHDTAPPQLHTLRQIGASGSQVGLAMAIEGALVAATGIVLGTLVALAVLVPFDNAIGAPGLPAGSPLIYLMVIAPAAALTIAVTSLSARRLRTAPSRV